MWLIVALVLGTTQTKINAQCSGNCVFIYYHSDHLGSSNIMVDRTGVIIQQNEYNAFGQRRIQADPWAFAPTHTYTGQDYDEVTGLMFYQSRYYDPEIGRFIQADSIVPSASDPQMLNRYTYVGNNPFKYVDPSGHEITAAAIAIGVIVGAAVGGATAAATGGNIWMGILTGAIGGLFGGFGAWAGATVGGMVGAAGAGTFVGSVAGSAAGGAVGAAVSGGDVGMGALTGAISGVIAFGAGQLQLKIGLDNWVDDLAGFGISSAAGALGGGIGAALQGGDFWEGAMYGAIGGAIGYGIAVDLPDAVNNALSANPRFHLIFGAVLEMIPDGLLRGSGDFFAGMSDVITLGRSKKLREKMSWTSGTVDYNSTSNTVGRYAGKAWWGAAGGAGTARVGAEIAIAKSGTAVGNWLSQGRYWRLGGSGWWRGYAGRQIPTLRILRAQPPRPWNHIDLRAFGH